MSSEFSELRVTQIVFDLDGGGLETLVSAIAKRLAGSAIKVSVISLSGRVGRAASTIRPTVEQFHSFKPVPLVSMALPLGLVRHIRATRADAVHIHSGAWLKGAWAARLAGVDRIIYTEHGREHDDPRLSRWLDRLASHTTDVVVAVSDRLRRYLQSNVGVRSDKLITLENGVDIEEFSPGQPPGDLRARLDIPANALVIGSVGRLEPVKAYDRLTKAVVTLRSLNRLTRPVVLVVCGDGSQRHYLEQLAGKLGARDVLRLPGWIDHPAYMYRLFDVFVLSSVSEGAPVSLLEAMACGVVPVVTDVGANAEILGAELSGQVVRSGDDDALAQKLSETLGSPDRRKLLGEIARRRVASHYTLDRMVDEYAKLYTADVGESVR